MTTYDLTPARFGGGGSEPPEPRAAGAMPDARADADLDVASIETLEGTTMWRAS